MKLGRLLVKDIKRMLLLQIWISIVFRVVRQFLTSNCDLLFLVGTKAYLYPRKYAGLMSSIVIDLKYWRPFVSCEPKLTLQNVLGCLPESSALLASDASSSGGMTGTILFRRRKPLSVVLGPILVDRVVWLGERIIAIESLAPGQVKINTAEFLGSLVTCETFTELCSGQITTIEIDNTSAKSWFDSARCPIFPFDRCAQGAYFQFLKYNMKLRTYWISSSDNKFAEIFSRDCSHMDKNSCLVYGTQMSGVTPKWRQVIR